MIPDEYPIAQIPPEAWWSENFFVGLGCFASGISLFTSIGRWHSDPTLWRENVVLGLPDGRVAFQRNYARQAEPHAAGGGLTRYAIIEPGRRMTLAFDGPMIVSSAADLIAHGPQVGPAARVIVDVTLEAAAPLWNMKGDSVEARTMAGSLHIDQSCAVTGTITVGEERFALTDAYAIRDHSRGVRDVSRYAGHNWLNGLFPSGRGFYCYVMRAPDGSIGMANAVVTQGEEILPATLVSTTFAQGPDDHGRAHELVLDCALGEMTIAFDPPMTVLPTSMVSPYDTCAGHTRSEGAAHMFDGASRIHWNGNAGHGWNERGFSPSRTGHAGVG